MLLIRSRLRSWEAGAEARLLIWAVCCIALKGAFRSAELLARTGSFFDPAFTLLAEDVAVVQATNGEGERVKALQVLVKAPKEDKARRATIVDVYESRDGCCPVRAFQKWANKASHREPGLPLFRLPDGTPLTSRKWNAVLRDRLKNFVPNPEVFSSHSFRSASHPQQSPTPEQQWYAQPAVHAAGSPDNTVSADRERHVEKSPLNQHAPHARHGLQISVGVNRVAVSSQTVVFDG